MARGRTVDARAFVGHGDRCGICGAGYVQDDSDRVCGEVIEKNAEIVRALVLDIAMGGVVARMKPKSHCTPIKTRCHDQQPMPTCMKKFVAALIVDITGVYKILGLEVCFT